ncbi:hypothetical protein BH09VER1_BH09VER1_50920 [soil metagenome]
MRPFLLILCLLPVLTGAEEPALSKFVKASLTFSTVDSEAPYEYEHALVVYLHLVNLRDEDIGWVANTAEIEAELLGPSAQPVAQGPRVSSILSNPEAFQVLAGSHFDWPISGGGVSIVEYPKNDYALIVGGSAWAIPISQVGSYSLRVRVRGFLGNSLEPYQKQLPTELLLEASLTKITITKAPPSPPAPRVLRAERP